MKKLIVAASIVLAGCATTEFKPFDAKTNVFEGNGGTKSAVDGIDIWDNGDPPRKFKILGVIEDERAGAVIPMMQLNGDIAKKARESGGDAVIKIGSQAQITGYLSNSSATATSYGNSATAFGTGVSMPMQRRRSKYVVIKYLD